MPTDQTIATLRSRVLFYHALAAFERGQTQTSLSGPTLAKLLCLEREPTTDDELVEELIDLLAEKLDVRWTGGRLVVSQPAKEAELEAEITRVLEHWRFVTGKVGCTFTAGRRRHVAARLREGYSGDQLCSAADALASSEFHMGDNDRGTPYNDVQHFAGSAERLDRWLATTPEGRSRESEDRMDRARQEADRRRRRRRRT